MSVAGTIARGKCLLPTSLVDKDGLSFRVYLFILCRNEPGSKSKGR